MTSDRGFFRSPWKAVLFAAIAAVLAFSRLYDLGARPVMHDESMFAYYTASHLVRGFDYQYLPILHGPAMLWIQAVVFHVFGVSEYTMRLGAALLGIGGAFWLWRMRRWLGDAGFLLAFAFYAVSPMLMYYQRFFRNDPLFVFASLWIIVSMLEWARTRSSAWAASGVVGCAVLFSNKESSVFIYFTLATFLALMVVRDLSVGWLRPAERAEPLRAQGPPFWATAIVLFAGVALVLTRVFEGLRFDDDVVRAIGRDFPLRDVDSIALALGRAEPVEDIGRLGSPWFWRAFYGMLAAASLAAGFLLQRAVERGWGQSSLLADCWLALRSCRWAIAWGLLGGFGIYMVLYTTGFQYPKGPFALYRETLGYWMGQHAWHRIEGPFHMHLVNLAVYEWPSLVVASIAVAAGLFRGAHRAGDGVALVLAGAAILVFHVVAFRGVEPMVLAFALAGLGAVAAGVLWIAFPGRAGIVLAASTAAFLAGSLVYFNSTRWAAFLSNPIGSDPAAPTGRRHLYEVLSLESGVHLFLIALLVLFGTLATWREIDRGSRYRGFLVWWTITSFGAASYAREKVPWIGIHAALPLILLAAAYAGALWDRLRTRGGRGIYLSIAAVLLLWTAKSAIHASFVHAGDVRERLSYGHTTADLRAHVELIRAYQRIAPVRHGEVRSADGLLLPEWAAHYNDPARAKQVRVLVAHEDLGWPLRWYLRDVEWSAWRSPESAIEDGWEFLVLSPRQAERLGDALDGYRQIRARSRMHWTPEVIPFDRLRDAWLFAVPEHRRRGTDAAARAAASADAWDRLRRAFVFREAFEHPEPLWSSLSWVEHVLCIRKDLPVPPAMP